MDQKHNCDKYIILTAVKNEEDNLLELIDSVSKQTILPLVWLIVDDCSTDKTPLIIEQACDEHKWIITKRLSSPSNHDLGLHLAAIIKESFNDLINYCKVNNISYNYLANLDGDLVLEPVFFEKLIKEFKNKDLLGIVSGHTYYRVNDELIPDNVNINEPSGGHMMIKKECFNACGGEITVSYSWDSVIKAKARIAGWETRRVIDASIFEVRDVSSARGYWEGYYYNGKSAYYRNLHPFHVLYKSARYCFKKPYYIGIAYLAAYGKDLLTKQKKIDDSELSEYFRNKYRNKEM